MTAHAEYSPTTHYAMAMIGMDPWNGWEMHPTDAAYKAEAMETTIGVQPVIFIPKGVAHSHHLQWAVGDGWEHVQLKHDAEVELMGNYTDPKWLKTFRYGDKFNAVQDLDLTFVGRPSHNTLNEALTKYAKGRLNEIAVECGADLPFPEEVKPAEPAETNKSQGEPEQLPPKPDETNDEANGTPPVEE